MKIGKIISVLISAIFVGSFLYGTHVSSEPQEVVQQITQANNHDDLFSAWLEKNKTFQKPTEGQLKQKLSDIQYDVTQGDGTERPFKNEFWDNKHDGIYVDIVSGEPLFSSTDKFKSGTGWPSFSQAISNKAMVEKEDRGFFGLRTEIRSSIADSHLGHVFEDGRASTGKRYCINSAALRFIPKEELAKEGYSEFSKLFE